MDEGVGGCKLPPISLALVLPREEIQLSPDLHLTKYFVRFQPPERLQLVQISSPRHMMASRSFSKALRTPLTRQLVSPAIQNRSFASAVLAVKAVVAHVPRASTCGSVQQTRGVKTIDFAGHKEQVFGMRLEQI